MAKNFCHHVKAGGDLCRALPLHDQNYCYFHMLTRDRLRRRRDAERRKQPLQFPIFEDAGSVQLALTDVANAVLHGALDIDRGRLILALLRTVLVNANALSFDRSHREHFVEFHSHHLNDGTELPDDETPPKIPAASVPADPNEAAS